MPQYAILRFAKMKGGLGALESHHERTKAKYTSNPDIDTTRSSRNFHIITPKASYKRESDSRIEAAGCNTRKDSVRFVDTLITASPDFFKGKKRAEVKDFFERAAEFLSAQVGESNIFTVVVHMDEKTPHMHLCFTPITEDGRLSAKEVIGDRNRLTKWQDDFFSYMVKAYPNLDRISRSILDFANMMALFQKHGVEFVSSTEKFDTSNPMGRAMLNICIVFAQLERETIIKRVSDAYYSRTRKGLRMGGKTPYGYVLEPSNIKGITTKKLVTDLDASNNVRLMYEMYSQPQVSLRDVARHFSENNILIFSKELFSSSLSELLRNPVYVQADMDVYEFFKSNGAEIEGDAANFTGLTGCCLFGIRDAPSRSRDSFQGKALVPSPHEGIIPSDLWLKCRKKLMANPKFQSARKPKQTWLAGKAKCGRCGFALTSIGSSESIKYLRCRNRAEGGSCEGCGTMRTHDLESLVYESMVDKLGEFNSLSSQKTVSHNPKLTAAKIELAQVESEIEKLVESLLGANSALISFTNRKAEELDLRMQGLMNLVAEHTNADIPAAKLTVISDYLSDWDGTSIDDKRQVADSLINIIRATNENVEIEWKI